MEYAYTGIGIGAHTKTHYVHLTLTDTRYNSMYSCNREQGPESGGLLGGQNFGFKVGTPHQECR